MARKQRTYKVGRGVVGKTRLFTVVDDASPELKELARQFPEHLSRSLSSLANQIGREIKATIKDGGTPAHKWKPLSLIHQHDRIRRYLGDRSVPGETLALGGRRPRRKRGEGVISSAEFKKGMFKRWAGAGDSVRATVFLGQAARAMGLYEKSTPATLKVEVGAINRTLEQTLDNFQAGVISPMNLKMRRTLWGAGIPTDNTYLVQPPRPLMDAVFERMQPYFETILMQRMQSYIEGKSGREIGDYKLPWR